MKIYSWNVNGIRAVLKKGQFYPFLEAHQPDVLCLQETKCPDDRFPLKQFKRFGYEHIALNGQKGYHGVVVASRLPFESHTIRSFCGKTDCRHVAVTFGERAGLRDPVTLHNFYEMRDCDQLRCTGANRMVLVGDLNVAPLEHDVWSHKQMLRVVSHTPRECEKLTAVQKVGDWVDAMRMKVPEPTKLYTWWSYRSPDWQTADKGRRLDHIWVAPALADRVASIDVRRNLRAWTRPSDHVPVTATLEV